VVEELRIYLTGYTPPPIATGTKMRPQTLVAASTDDPVMRALRTLRDQYQAGEISRAEYIAEFRRLNLFVGVPCEQCLIRLAHSIAPDGRRLCAQCGARERGIE
jgi:hypothetical protein